MSGAAEPQFINQSINPGTEQPPASRSRKIGSTLRFRLALVVLVTSLPILSLMAILLTRQAQDRLESAAIASLQSANQTVTFGSEIWLNQNNGALKNLAAGPDIRSMQASEQEPLLVSMAESFPHMYLVSTTDLSGKNIARSDGQDPTDYSDRPWFQQAAAGSALSYQTLLGRTTGQPALVSSVPIQDENGEIVGVAMYAADLDDVATLVRSLDLGEGGLAYIVDASDVVVAHTDPAFTSELRNANEVAELQKPVQALRAGTRGSYVFTDPNGVTWRAELNSLENGWGVITQQPESALFAPVIQFRNLAIVILAVGAALLILLSWSVIGRALRPVRTLTEAASAIAQGNLEEQAAVTNLARTSQDELGLLAASFNTMSNQLRGLIEGLEERVAQRTRDLERRALQLEVTAEVAREAAATRNLEQLLSDAAQLISKRFGFYHAGIFLIGGLAAGQDDSPSSAGRWAILRAASSQGGQKMLARGHRLRVGQVGIVGYVAAAGQPRIALDVGEDAVFFNNPDLPLTRSEMALPLKVQERIIGVLDVQSEKSGAFKKEDLDTLQILADQLALAIESARLLNESQVAAREMGTLLGLQTRQRWSDRIRSSQASENVLDYRIDPRSGEIVPGRIPALEGSQPLDEMADGTYNGLQTTESVSVPIEVRGQRIGALQLRRSPDQPWTESERELVQRTVQQAALALENARLVEEIQQNAAQEQIINQITASLQRSMNVDTVMRMSVEQMGRLVSANALQIRLIRAEEQDGDELLVSEEGG